MIKTRKKSDPTQKASMPTAKAGQVQYCLLLGEAELELIASLTWLTRLGPGKYKAAAANLSNAVENLTHDDFSADASINIDPHFSITDDAGNMVDQYSGEFVTIEV